MMASEQIAGIKKKADRREVADLEEWKRLQPKSQLRGYQKGEICPQVLLIRYGW